MSSESTSSSSSEALLQILLLRKGKLSPIKLLIIQFVWIIPYILFANYLERSLVAFRLSCYTQSDLLSHRPYASSTQECVDKLFHGTRSLNETCTIKDNIDIAFHPRLPSSSFDTIVVVRSSPKAIEYRNLIRRTWMKDVSHTSPVFFVIGLGVDVTEEASHYGDLLVFNFTDSYFALPKKMTATYGWFLSTFPSSSKLLVVNDDTIVNGSALQKLSLPPSSDAWMLGKVSRGYPRIIFPWITWFVSNSQYPELCYPRFTQGSSFIVSRAALSVIWDGVCSVPILPLDDIWTGVLSLCLPFEQIHAEGFDVHWQWKSFVVFHYQFSRYSADHLQNLYDNMKLE